MVLRTHAREVDKPPLIDGKRRSCEAKNGTSTGPFLPRHPPMPPVPQSVRGKVPKSRVSDDPGATLDPLPTKKRILYYYMFINIVAAALRHHLHTEGAPSALVQIGHD